MNTLLGIGSNVDDSDDDVDRKDVNGTDNVHAVATNMVDIEMAAFKAIPKSACKDPTSIVKWWATSPKTSNAFESSSAHNLVQRLDRVDSSTTLVSWSTS